MSFDLTTKRQRLKIKSKAQSRNPKGRFEPPRNEDAKMRVLTIKSTGNTKLAGETPALPGVSSL
jgi:hypothetical protein